MKKNVEISPVLHKYRLKKMFMTTKLCIVLTFGGLLNLNASVFLQQKVSIQLGEAGYKEVFSEITKQTGLTFMYSDSGLKDDMKVVANFKDAELEYVLKTILKGKDLTYLLQDEFVVIMPKEKMVEQQQKEKRIKGKVCDEKGNPLPGVSVVDEGSGLGVATDSNGEFYIVLANEKDMFLTFSFIGFEKKTISVDTGKFEKVVLIEKEEGLDEVVVLAYDAQKEKEVVSSVSTLTAKDIKEVAADNFVQLLQGKMTGVKVTQTSGVPGGAGTKIDIRGFNSLMVDGESDGSPLYVVDGVPMASFVSPVTGTNVVSDLNPENIESISVLKDAASAALYGSRAANGVIMITTKKGKAGYDVFSVNMSQSYTYNPEYPEMIGGALERRWTLMKDINTHEPWYDWDKGYMYATSYLDATNPNYWGVEYDENWNRGREHNDGGGMVHDSINSYYNNSTNWFRQNYQIGRITNCNIQASGGTEKIKYLVGGGVYDNKGIMVNTTFKRIDGVVNLTVQPVRNLDINSRTIIAYTDRSLNTGKSSFGLNKGDTDFITANPLITSTLLRATGSGAEDQLKYMRGSVNKADAYRINTSFGLTYNFLKHFNWSNNFSWDLQQNHSNQFQPSYLAYNNKSKSAGTVTRNQQLQFESILRFDKSFYENHNIGLMLGYSINRETYNLIYGEGYEGPSNDVHYVGMGGWPKIDVNTGTVQLVYTSDFTEKMMVGLFSRFNYNYKQKYLLSATIRKDGSSTFGIDTRWGYFPSVGLGWNFTDENFMDWAHWLDNGKIRASWGRTGRPFTQPYLAHGAVKPADKTFNGHALITPSSINYKLEWEKSDQYDIGLDLSFYNRRIITKFDYYYKYTFDILNKVTLPGNTSGLQEMWANCMALSNEGVEFSIDAVILRDSDLKWRSRFNISRNWNKLEETFDDRDFRNNILGKSINRMKVYLDDGFYAEGEKLPVSYDLAGNMKYTNSSYGANTPASYSFRKIKDLNGDGRIDEEDAIYLESTLPAAYGGFSNEFQYKNFSLSFLLNFTLGQHMIDGLSYESMVEAPYIINPNRFTFYDQVGASADLPNIGGYDSSTRNYETYLASRVENVSYLKLNTLTFGYDLSRDICNKMNIKQLRVFFTGGNLFRIDNFSGSTDPEQVTLSTGVAGNAYPLSRNITIGLTAKF